MKTYKAKYAAMIVCMVCSTILIVTGLLTGEIVLFPRNAGTEAVAVTKSVPASLQPYKANRLPCLAEIQELVGTKPDGIWGDKTKAAWEKAYIAQSAAASNHYYEVIDGVDLIFESPYCFLEDSNEHTVIEDSDENL